MTKRKKRWVLWIAVSATLVATTGIVDVTVRVHVRSEVKSAAAHATLVNIVQVTTLREVSDHVEEAIDGLNGLEALYMRVFCPSKDATKEQKLGEAQEFVDQQAMQMSIHVLSEPPWGLGWKIDSYRFEARWNGDPLARFRLNFAGQPVKVSPVRGSKYEEALKQRLERRSC